MEEIRENDYNLNIPRYVDTFEEEDPIDIPAVKQEIKDLEEKKAGIKTELEALFQELGV